MIKNIKIITGVGNAQYTSDTTVSLSGITNNGEIFSFMQIMMDFVVREGDLVIYYLDYSSSCLIFPSNVDAPIAKNTTNGINLYGSFVCSVNVIKSGGISKNPEINT